MVSGLRKVRPMTLRNLSAFIDRCITERIDRAHYPSAGIQEARVLRRVAPFLERDADEMPVRIYPPVTRSPK